MFNLWKRGESSSCDGVFTTMTVDGADAFTNNGIVLFWWVCV